MFRLCNPFLVTSQVKTSKVQVQQAKYLINSADDDEDSKLLDQSQSGNLKTKPKTSSRKSNSLEEEIFNFILDLKWNHDTYQQFEENLLGASGSYLCYEFEFHQMTFSYKLVKVMRQEFELNNLVIFTREDLDISLKCLLQLIENYAEFPVGHDPTSPFNGNCFTSLEYAFICVDIITAALLRYIMQQRAHAAYEVLIPSLTKLLVATLSLFSFTTENNRIPCTIAFSLMLVKCSQIVHIFAEDCAVILTDLRALFKVIDLLPHLHHSIQLVQKLSTACSSLTYDVTIVKLWMSMEKLLGAVNVCVQRETSSSASPMLLLYKQKLWRVILDAMPSSGALILEMQLRETNEMHPLSGMNDRNLECMVRDILLSVGPESPGKLLAALDYGTDTDSGPVHLQSVQVQSTFHLRFLMVGLMRIVHVNYFPILPLTPPSSVLYRQPAPEIDHIFQTLYEVLTYTTKDKILLERLYIAPTIVQLMRTLAKTAKLHSNCHWIFWNLAKNLSDFNDWLKIRLRALRQRSNTAESMEASGLLARSTSTASLRSQDTKDARVLTTSHQHSLQQQIHRHMSGSQELVKPMVTHPVKQQSFDLTMETPFKDLQPSILSPQAVQVPAAVVFKIGDRVDGLVTLSNGTQRWFPGQITCVYPDDNGGVTYDLLFADGDTGLKMASSDVRLTKQRVRPNAKAAAPLSSVGGSLDAPLTTGPASGKTVPVVSVVPTPMSSVALDLGDSQEHNPYSFTPILRPIALNFAVNQQNEASSQLAKAEIEYDRQLEAQLAGEMGPQHQHRDGITGSITPPAQCQSPDFALSPFSESLQSISYQHSPTRHLSAPVTGPGTEHHRYSALPVQMSTEVTQDSDRSPVKESTDEVPSLSMNPSPASKSALLRTSLQLEHVTQVDVDEDDDSDDDDHIYEIPSIFDNGHHRLTNGSHLAARGDNIVPRMQFSNLPLTSSMQSMGMGMSLSAALLPEPMDSNVMSASSSNALILQSGGTPVLTENGSLYNLSGLKVVSGRQTPSFILSQRGGVYSNNNSTTINNNNINLNTTRSMVTTHRSVNDLDESYQTLESSLGNGSVVTTAVTTTRGVNHHHHHHPNLVIGNFATALQQHQLQQQQLQQQQQSYTLQEQELAITTNNTRILSWQHASQSGSATGGISARQPQESDRTSGRTLALHNSGHNLRPNQAPPDQLIIASQETKEHRSRNSSHHHVQYHPQHQQQSQHLSSLSPTKMGLMSGKHSSVTTSSSTSDITRKPSTTHAKSDKVEDSMFFGAKYSEELEKNRHIQGKNTNEEVMEEVEYMEEEVVSVEEAAALRLLLQTQLVVSLMLIDFSILYAESPPPAHSSSLQSIAYLKQHCCVSHEHASAASIAAATLSVDGKTSSSPLAALPLSALPQVNMLFHVREFFEVGATTLLSNANPVPSVSSVDEEQNSKHPTKDDAVNESKDEVSQVNAVTTAAGNEEALALGQFVLSQADPAYLLLCKLLSPFFFPGATTIWQQCMQQSGEKIGEGGFGSVFKISCPPLTKRSGPTNWGQFGLSHCLSCHLQCTLGPQKVSSSLSTGESSVSSIRRPKPCRCWRSLGLGHQEVVSSEAGNNSAVYAVKRLTRERSQYDDSRLFALFQELHCLQQLQDCIGVCGLEDFGVCGGEYWVIMEHGFMNLQEWRTTALLLSPSLATNVTQKNNAHDNLIASASVEPTQLKKPDLLLCLLLWLEVLVIVDELHARDIAHFDLKACNFLLRDDPCLYRDSLLRVHRQNIQQLSKSGNLHRMDDDKKMKLSLTGLLFVADFGESVAQVSQPHSLSLRKQCRGTLSIQSPEMLSISEPSDIHHLQNNSHNQICNDMMSSMTSGVLCRYQQALGGHIAESSVVSLHDLVRRNDINSTLVNDNASNEEENGMVTPVPTHNQRGHTQNSGGASPMIQVARSFSPSPHSSVVRGSTKGSGARNNQSTSIQGLHKQSLLHDESNSAPTINHMNSIAQGQSVKSATLQQFGLPDARSDLWSVACLLVEVMTGKSLFGDVSWVELFSRFCLIHTDSSSVKSKGGTSGPQLTTTHQQPVTVPIDFSALHDVCADSSSFSASTTSATASSESLLAQELESVLRRALQPRPEARATCLELWEATAGLIERHFQEDVQRIDDLLMHKNQSSVKDTAQVAAEKEIWKEMLSSEDTTQQQGGESTAQDQQLQDFLSITVSEQVLVLDESFAHASLSQLLMKYYPNYRKSATASNQPGKSSPAKPLSNKASVGSSTISSSTSGKLVVDEVVSTSHSRYRELTSCTPIPMAMAEQEITAEEPLVRGLWPIVQLERELSLQLQGVCPPVDADLVVTQDGSHKGTLASLPPALRRDSADSLVAPRHLSVSRRVLEEEVYQHLRSAVQRSTATSFPSGKMIWVRITSAADGKAFRGNEVTDLATRYADVLQVVEMDVTHWESSAARLRRLLASFASTTTSLCVITLPSVPPSNSPAKILSSRRQAFAFALAVGCHMAFANGSDETSVYGVTRLLRRLHSVNGVLMDNNGDQSNTFGGLLQAKDFFAYYHLLSGEHNRINN